MTKTIMHIAEAPGGVERYLVTLVTKLKKYSEFEHILVCSTTFDKDKFKGLAKKIIVVDSMHNAISFSSDLKAVLAVRKAIMHYRPEIVYCHSSKAGAIGRIANFGIKNKLIYNAHGWSFNIKGASRKKIKTYESIERIAEPGKEYLAIEEGITAFDGRKPINPSGGLIGCGHPVGASGARMFLDLYKQVTGQAGKYQVSGAKNAMMLNIGGSATTNYVFVVGNE